MELWIRSQDKQQLIKVDKLDVIYNTFNCEPINFIITNNSDELGSYKTKERALEVLDEIQNHLLKMGENEILTDKIGNMNGIKHYGIVYEMPKD